MDGLERSIDGLERSGRGGKKTERIRRRLVCALADGIKDIGKEDQPEALALEIAELDRIFVEANAICKDLSRPDKSETREFLVVITPEHARVAETKRGASGAPLHPPTHPF